MISILNPTRIPHPNLAHGTCPPFRYMVALSTDTKPSIQGTDHWLWGGDPIVQHRVETCRNPGRYPPNCWAGFPGLKAAGVFDSWIGALVVGGNIVNPAHARSILLGERLEKPMETSSVLLRMASNSAASMRRARRINMQMLAFARKFPHDVQAVLRSLL